MRQRLRQGQRLLTPLQGLVRIAQRPQDHRPPWHGRAPRSAASPQGRCRGRVLLGVVEGNPLLQVGAGAGKGAHVVQGIPQRVWASGAGGVVLALGQVEELLRHGLRRLVLPPHEIKPPQPIQHRESCAVSPTCCTAPRPG